MRNLKYFKGINPALLLFSLVVGGVFSFLFINKILLYFYTGNAFLDLQLSAKIGILFFSTLIIAILIYFFCLISYKVIHFLFSEDPPEKRTEHDQFVEKSKHNLINALVIVGIGMASIFLINNVFQLINTADWSFKNPTNLPVITPIGNDFRVGLYRPAQQLLSDFNLYSPGPNGYITQYPPLVNVFSLPFLLFSESIAYLIQVFLLYFVNLFCIYLGVIIAKKYLSAEPLPEKSFEWILLIFLLLIFSFFTLTGYPFIFSIERGNYDIYAMLFSLLALWCLLKLPEHIWLQVILLSIATHLKIYPAILFIVLFAKHGKKTILPLLVVNSAFLLILGPQNAIGFLKVITSSASVGARWAWVGNHSGFSFVNLLVSLNRYLEPYLDLLLILSIGVPLVLWVFVIIKINAKDFNNRNIILLFMSTTSLMCLIPSISHDYKLVILSTTIMFLMVLIIKRITLNGKPLDYVQLVMVILIMFFLSYDPLPIVGGYQLTNTTLFVFFNKYIWVLILFILMSWNVLITLHTNSNENNLFDHSLNDVFLSNSEFNDQF